jgi:anti-sigma B factor antagonist
MNLRVKSRRLEDKVGVVEVFGEVDLYSAPQAKQAMLELVEGGVVHLLIDLRNTDYLDSTAMGILVGMLRRVAENDGWVRLIGPRPRVRKLFEITRLDQILPIFETEEDALAGLDGKETAA